MATSVAGLGSLQDWNGLDAAETGFAVEVTAASPSQSLDNAVVVAVDAAVAVDRSRSRDRNHHTGYVADADHTDPRKCHRVLRCCVGGAVGKQGGLVVAAAAYAAADCFAEDAWQVFHPDSGPKKQHSLIHDTTRLMQSSIPQGP